MMILCSVTIITQDSNICNSQFVLKCGSFSVESALSTIPKGFPLPKEKHGKPLGDLLLWGKRAAEGVGPYRGNEMCGREMKEM